MKRRWGKRKDNKSVSNGRYLFALSILRNSEAEREIIPRENVNELESDLQRPRLGFVFSEQECHVESIKKYIHEIGSLGARFKYEPLSKQVKAADLEKA